MKNGRRPVALNASRLTSTRVLRDSLGIGTPLYGKKCAMLWAVPPFEEHLDVCVIRAN